jgi:peroxiredoxin
VGNQVGERVPDFTLKLADGTQVTSQELLVKHRPTYLFFFATW